MKLSIFLIVIIYFTGVLSISGQSKPSWVIQAKVSNGQVELDWYPTNAQIWKQGLISGYTLTRETLSGGGTAPFIPNQIMLKDSVWFNTNVKSQSGVLSPIKSILYSNNFLQKSNNDNDELQFNYIVYECTFNIGIAEALGQGFVDKNVSLGSTYRYTLRHNKSGQTSSITVKCENGVRLHEPQNYNHTFNWPDGNSLSDLEERSKPFKLNAIIGMARPKMDSVILRWVPMNINILRMALNDGYEIWRSAKGVEATLIATVKPWTEAQIRQMPRTDTLAMFAASCVLDKAILQGIDKAKLIDQALMEQNYFGITLMAADRSALAADVLGLRYVDKEVKFGETYHYEIQTKQLKPNFPVPDIWVTNEYEPLVAPEKFKTQKNEKSVTLRWLPNSDARYGSFIIERLDPGDTVYHSITKQPIVFIRDAEMNDEPFSYIDSLPTNNIVFSYRIKGSNAFGEWSEYAYETAYGRDLTPPEAVSIVSGKFRKDSIDIIISWTLNKKDKDLKYFQVLVSEKPDYNFVAISKPLPSQDTVFIMSLIGMDIDRSFYFKVNSVDSSENISTSASRYVFTPDDERPLAPAKIKASISEKGLVTVSWNPSTSKDVVGYYVFFSNSDPTNLALVYDKPLKDTTYSWQIDMVSLTKYLYVAVKSEDDNYNRSFLTEVLQLRRPDTIAPVSPLLMNVEVNNEKVKLDWRESGSSDVVKYLIFTRNSNDSLSKWIVIDSVDSKSLTFFTQSDVLDGKVEYAIKAIDDFGNQSKYSNTREVYIPFPGYKFVPQINTIVNGKNSSVDVAWQKNKQSIKGKDLSYTYQVFRSVGSGDVTIYRELPSNEFRINDDKVEPGVLYNYALRVKYSNGWTGDLGEVKSILVK